jgi:hypothetical protein
MAWCLAMIWPNLVEAPARLLAEHPVGRDPAVVQE